MHHEFICIVCPQGCRLQVQQQDQEIQVSGNRCKRGETYAEKELTAPRRVITSTVKIENAATSRLPVKTTPDIPKEHIFDCMREINRIRVTAPVKAGDVLLKNILDTGADIVATRDMKQQSERL